MLEKAGVRTMLNELSSTVVFERPREEAFVRKWQLACEGDIAHVVRQQAASAYSCVGARACVRVRAGCSCRARCKLLSAARAAPPDHGCPPPTTHPPLPLQVVMPNITIRKLETFVQELFESR